MKLPAKLIFPLLALVIFALAVFARFYGLADIKGYYFDEVYHVPTAKMIAHSDPRAYQWWHSELAEEIQTGTFIDWLHPPLAKLFQATSILFFGNNEWGWRFPSALFGTLLVGVVYLLAKAACPKKPLVPLLAMTLAAIDGLAIAQSRIAMNDIFVTFFMALGVLFYLYFLKEKRAKRWLLPLALACGCSVASKWSGVFLLLFIGLWELAVERMKPRHTWRETIGFGVLLASSSVLIYLLSYFQLFAAHNFSHFGELHRQILMYQTSLDAEHPYASSALEWPLGLKPVYLYLNPETDQQVWNRPFYPSWFFGFACLIVALGLLFVIPWLMVSRKLQGKPPLKFTISPTQFKNLLFFVVAYFFFWFFWTFSPRIMFFYHYLPATPMLWVVTALTVHLLIPAFLPHSDIMKADLKQKGNHE